MCETGECMHNKLRYELMQRISNGIDISPRNISIRSSHRAQRNTSKKKPGGNAWMSLRCSDRSHGANPALVFLTSFTSKKKEREGENIKKWVQVGQTEWGTDIHYCSTIFQQTFFSSSELGVIPLPNLLASSSTGAVIIEAFAQHVSILQLVVVGTMSASEWLTNPY